MTGHHVEHIPLDNVLGAVRNPKAHDLEIVRASVERFGYVSPAVRDDRTGRLVVGHGRTEVLRQLRDEGQNPPAGVQVAPDGSWLVPVICGWSSRSDAEAEAYLIADNQHPALGGWDDDGLATLLSDLAEADAELFALTGFTDEDLSALLEAAGEGEGGGPAAGLTDPDDVPDLPDEPVTRPGDVWRLGKHRLLCADSTDVSAVEAMLDGDRADCMWTDPPYGVDYGNFATPEAARKMRRRTDGKRVQNDHASDLPGLLSAAFATATIVLKPGAAVYVAHPAGALHRPFLEAFFTAGWRFHEGLVWVKDTMVLGHSDYHYRHEPIMFGYTAGAAGRLGRGGDGWYGDNSQTSVFEVPRPKRSEAHPTMKPVALVAAMLANSCPDGGLVYEPFGGSGSTLLAAHQLGMRAAVVEIDPLYCDVICRRWHAYSGVAPVLESTGQAVDFVAGEAEPADIGTG